MILDTFVLDRGIKEATLLAIELSSIVLEFLFEYKGPIVSLVSFTIKVQFPFRAADLPLA
ncbi:hypothetical protein [Clostridioides difficile]|uniref:hypothetical protein n=1 Tax=Clostridioides difficile TaxID=1496 RepID=UPI0002EDE384|nr:hypothetical protein [Clostridioides difficile]